MIFVARDAVADPAGLRVSAPRALRRPTALNRVRQSDAATRSANLTARVAPAQRDTKRCVLQDSAERVGAQSMAPEDACFPVVRTQA